MRRRRKSGARCAEFVIVPGSEGNMARRSKRLVKQRSKAHQKKVKTARRRKKKAHPKVGYGAKKRRAKKAAKKTGKKK
jgi:hypothetical protein